MPALDRLLDGVHPGDNIVWQVDEIDDYQALVRPFAGAALQAGRPLVYFRFASHQPLLPEDCGAQVVSPNPADGFEGFVTQVHTAIEATGRHGAYVFDCLSDMASLWSADQMLGNFFLLTCPRLHELGSISYLGLYRNYHASFAMHPVTETAEFLLDVFRHAGAALRPSDQGPAPFARFQLYDPSLERRRVPAADGQRGTRRFDGLQRLARPARRHAGRILAADLP